MMRRTIASIAVLSVAGTLFASALANEDRGFLGVLVTPLSEDTANELGVDHGVVLADVLPDSPAARAGVLKDDVLLKIDGDRVVGPQTVTEKIRGLGPDSKVTLTLRRGSEAIDVEVTLGRFSEARVPGKILDREVETAEVVEDSDEAEESAQRPGFLGVQFEPVPDVLSRHLGLEHNGVLLTNVLSDSPARTAGLKDLDIILEVDGKGVTPDTFVGTLSDRKSGETVELAIVDRGERKTLSVTLGERPEEFPAVGERPAPWFDRDGSLRPGRRLFQIPHFRGRLRLLGPDGEDRTLEIPQLEGNLDQLGEKLRSELKKNFNTLPEDFQKNFEAFEKRMKKLAEEIGSNVDGVEFDLDLDLKDLEAGQLPGIGKLDSTHTSSRTMTVLEDGYRVTLKDEDGRRTVTVVKDGETLAENLPLDKLDTLEENARERVNAVRKRFDHWKRDAAPVPQLDPREPSDAEGEKKKPGVKI